MRQFILLIFSFSFAIGQVSVSDGHIAPCRGSKDHSDTGGICYGYAMGRAAGRYPGDEKCNPLTFYRNTVDANYFDFNSGSSLSGLQAGDIVRFPNHVAYVVSVRSPIESTLVDQYSPAYGHERGKTLAYVKNHFGPWDGYYRRKPVNDTVKNNFNGGVIKIDGVEKNSGIHSLAWWGSERVLEAVDRQYFNGYVWVFDKWSTPQGEEKSISISITPRVGKTYVAVFKIFRVQVMVG